MIVVTWIAGAHKTWYDGVVHYSTVDSGEYTSECRSVDFFPKKKIAEKNCFFSCKTLVFSSDMIFHEINLLTCLGTNLRSRVVLLAPFPWNRKMVFPRVFPHSLDPTLLL